MSLARLALRLAAYEALCPFASLMTGPWPTLAGKNVFDSRIDLIQSDDKPTIVEELEGKPLLIVYTEEDVSTPYPGAKKPPDEQIVHLVVEAMIAATGKVTVPDPNGGDPVTVGTIQAPITDRQHEAMLDALEAQVRRILDDRNRMPSAAIFTGQAWEVRQIESYPQRDGDRVTRVAARTLKFHVKVKPDHWPKVPRAIAPTGLDLLPEPLRSVAYALPAGSTGLAVCQQTAAWMLPAPSLPPTLAGIGIATDVDRDPENASPTQVFSEAAAPDTEQ